MDWWTYSPDGGPKLWGKNFSPPIITIGCHGVEAELTSQPGEGWLQQFDDFWQQCLSGRARLEFNFDATPRIAICPIPSPLNDEHFKP